MKGTFDKKSHITGERNLGNTDGDVFSPDRRGNINYSKTTFSANNFFIGISLLILISFQICFCWYVLRELSNYKQWFFINQKEFEKIVNDRLDLQAKAINLFFDTHGE